GNAARPRRRWQRVEWCSGAAAAAQPGPRQPRAAGASGTEFRPGYGRHPHPALGPIALSIPWRTSFPSSKVRPYQPQASKPGVFFASQPPGFATPYAACDNNRPGMGPDRKIKEDPMRSMRPWSVLLLAAAVLSLSGCGYNTLQAKDEAVKAAWSEAVNQYQRRADLIPNLVNTVKGYAAQEQRVLVGVTEARARVGSIQVTPEILNNPELFKKFQDAQNQLTSALKSLFAVTENYPQLKSDQNFRDLQSQLEGTENRITVARNRYIQAVQDYNVTARTFPTLITAQSFGFHAKPNFTRANAQH